MPSLPRPALLALLLIGLTAASACSAEDGAQAAPTETPRQDLRVVTFNVLCSFCVDKGYDPWVDRVPHLQSIIAQHDPDLMGLQELFWTAPDNDEVQMMMAANPVYTPLYFVNEPGKKPVSFPDATVYFRTERFEKKDGGFFWLSEQPDKPFSGGWAKANFPRIVAWAVLLDRNTKRELYFATTHFDNNSPNQEMSAPLLLSKVAPFAANMPVIITGDFNSNPSTKAYQTLVGPLGETGHKLINTWDVAKDKAIIHNAEAEPAYDDAARIDHIFARSDTLAVQRWIVDVQRFGTDSKHPSDHRLMMATLTL